MRKRAKDLPPPRVRKEPPTIEEAISAAQDLSDDREAQIEIAAGFMGVSIDEVRPLMPLRVKPATSIIAGNRSVVVERRVARPSLRRIAAR
ncbi:hypothetical protein [Enterovirga rhinocerotis]|uniref:Uncharacterized protein n=1 Tax=Enterovirga rhinocerotis TaxID=1339210 RepID=A0A4R7BXZ6_9HYPH|nr:hypothetical protein [Enterovirga rhinocerotis]TDR90403.1 hypothetical protein EV668_3254 [Enterovirga rhinocerotis]